MRPPLRLGGDERDQGRDFHDRCGSASGWERGRFFRPPGSPARTFSPVLPWSQALSDDEIISEAREAFERAVEAEAENRREALDDLRFARLGEQWPAEI